MFRSQAAWESAEAHSLDTGIPRHAVMLSDLPKKVQRREEIVSFVAGSDIWGRLAITSYIPWAYMK